MYDLKKEPHADFSVLFSQLSRKVTLAGSGAGAGEGAPSRPYSPTCTSLPESACAEPAGLGGLPGTWDSFEKGGCSKGGAAMVADV